MARIYFTFLKLSQNKLEILLIPNFDLSKKNQKGVYQVRETFALLCDLTPLALVENSAKILRDTKIVKTNKFEGNLGQVRIRKAFKTISHKISETNCKVFFALFRSFLGSINKIFILLGEWALGYYFEKFRRFSNIFYLKSLVLSHLANREATRL